MRKEYETRSPIRRLIAINKKLIILLSVMLAFAIPTASICMAAPTKYDNPEIRITLDGRELPLKADMPKLINGVVYTPLRDTVVKLKLNIYWDSETNLISVFNGEDILQFNVDTGKAYWNGVSKQMPPSFLYNSKTYISIQYLTDFFGYQITTENYGRTIHILSTAVAKEVMSQNKSYEKRAVGRHTSEDIFWMAKIVHAEAQGESYEAKLAVANVVLNRMEYSAYPDSIKEIIFDKKSGVQFTPAMNGSIYCKPSPDSIRAAIDSLGGKNNAKGALFFINPDYASNTWVSDNRKFAFQLESHSFYY